MSKPTVSAAGGAMPAEGQKTRRAALALFAGAPALAILPAAAPALALVSTASPLHPDAALLAMQSAIDAANEQLDAAIDALTKAEGAYRELDRPDRPDRPEQPAIFSPEEQQALDTFAAKLRERNPAWAAYEQAVQDYAMETELLKTECGVTAAHEMEEAAHEADRQVLSDVIDTPAKTLAGLIFKARFAEKRDYDEQVMVSIVADLLAMADHPEGGANV
jgi:hypothetical protein